MERRLETELLIGTEMAQIGIATVVCLGSREEVVEQSESRPSEGTLEIAGCRKMGAGLAGSFEWNWECLVEGEQGSGTGSERRSGGLKSYWFDMEYATAASETLFVMGPVRTWVAMGLATAELQAAEASQGFGIGMDLPDLSRTDTWEFIIYAHPTKQLSE